MGIFDDSDSDDDKKHNRKAPLQCFDDFSAANSSMDALKLPTPASGNGEAVIYTHNDDDDDDNCNDHEKEEDDEEDPLDAYMVSLNETESTQKKASVHNNDNRNNSKVQRFDIDDDSQEDFQSYAANQQHRFEDESDERSSKNDGPHLLSVIDHSLVKYEPFSKDFYSSKTVSSHDGQLWRSTHSVTISSSANGKYITPDPITKFDDLEGVFPVELLSEIQKCGYTTPTPIQEQCLPIALSGQDLIGIASTGSGKTLAFVLPMVVHCCNQREIEAGKDGPICVVLSPTRELALQTFSHAKRMLGAVGGHAIALFGGMGRYEMSKELKRGAECIIGTPGRVIDMIKSKATNLTRCTLVVLDEADKMLEMGFERQVLSVLKNIRPERQTFLFSATFKNRVSSLAEFWLNKNYMRIDVGKAGASSEHVDQHVMVLRDSAAKRDFMCAMMPVFVEVGRIIIFVATRAEAEDLATMLSNLPDMKNRIGAIHGDKSQHERIKVLSLFKKGDIVALCATDVAARGLDIPNVKTVVNFDTAKSLDAHTHRVGRAGRLRASSGNEGGKHQQGTSYTLVTYKDRDFANSLMQQFRRENRDVTKEHEELAKQSKYYKNYGNVLSSKRGGTTLSGFVRSSCQNDDYYGPSSSKKSKCL